MLGPGIDEPLVHNYASGARRWLSADERGSIIAFSDNSGAVTAVNSYDEYGVWGSGNGGRFGYTGQLWLSELGTYHYKARAYSPQLGRFLQTDPIGYAGGINLYAYVGNDPVNFVDPTGTAMVWVPKYACAGVQGSLSCGWTGYYDWRPDLFPVGTIPAVQGEFGSGPRASRHGCIIRGNCQPDQWPAPQPQTPEKTTPEQCPAVDSIIGQTRYWSSRTADIAGNASNVSALGGLIPSPASPGLLASAAGLRAISGIASGTLLIADLAYGIQSGNFSVFAGDMGNFAVGSIPVGRIAVGVNRRQPSGTSLSPEAESFLEKATDVGQGFNVTENLPAGCK